MFHRSLLLRRFLFLLLRERLLPIGIVDLYWLLLIFRIIEDVGDGVTRWGAWTAWRDFPFPKRFPSRRSILAIIVEIVYVRRHRGGKRGEEG